MSARSAFGEVVRGELTERPPRRRCCCGALLCGIFRHAGTFVYYCRFHAVLDADSQPKAPGPMGGIQDPDGNFGTPMNGIVTVLPGDQGQQD